MAKKTIHLTFPDKLIQEPVVYRLGHEFKVVTSIFRASVGDKDAWIVLQLDGEEEEVLRATASLRDMGILVKELSQSEI